MFSFNHPAVAAYPAPLTLSLLHHQFPILQLFYYSEQQYPSPQSSPNSLNPKAPEFLPNAYNHLLLPDDNDQQPCLLFYPSYSHHLSSSPPPSNPSSSLHSQPLPHPSPPTTTFPLPPPLLEHDKSSCRLRSSSRPQHFQKGKPKGSECLDCCSRPFVSNSQKKRHPPRNIHATLQPVDDKTTTLMIRNIPNKYTRAMLVAFMDEHCKKENERSEFEDESSYDFVYLPIDFTTGCNKGYAFVNFTNSSSAWRFKLGSHNTSWEYFHSSKIREIVTAKIQGKEALVKHFEMSSFACSSDEFLPACFSPARDGSGREVTQVIVGKRNVE